MDEPQTRLLDKQTLSLIRFQFEYFGEELSALADSYQVPLMLLERVSKDACWERKQLPVVLGQSAAPTDLATMSGNLLEMTRIKSTMMYALHQQLLSPKYFEAERAILDKLVQVTNNVSPSADNAGTQMRALVSALKDLQERQHVMKVVGSSDEEKGSGDGRITVQILNQVN